jgi:hypothetical protein
MQHGNRGRLPDELSEAAGSFPLFIFFVADFLSTGLHIVTIFLKIIT